MYVYCSCFISLIIIFFRVETVETTMPNKAVTVTSGTVVVTKVVKNTVTTLNENGETKTTTISESKEVTVNGDAGMYIHI